MSVKVVFTSVVQVFILPRFDMCRSDLLLESDRDIRIASACQGFRPPPRTLPESRLNGPVAADIADLGNAGIPDEALDEPRNVQATDNLTTAANGVLALVDRKDVVASLLSLEAENLVDALFDVAADEDMPATRMPSTRSNKQPALAISQR